jgi:sulfur relay (sulfurtransferase) DsrF/TusC family protein
MISGPCPGSRLYEGLRMITSFIGMDHIPAIIFMEDGLLALRPNALGEKQREYLELISDMAGVWIVEEELRYNNILYQDLDQTLSIDIMNFSELSKKIQNSSTIATF